jgi:hypothetical protein
MRTRHGSLWPWRALAVMCLLMSTCSTSAQTWRRSNIGAVSAAAPAWNHSVIVGSLKGIVARLRLRDGVESACVSIFCCRCCCRLLSIPSLYIYLSPAPSPPAVFTGRVAFPVHLRPPTARSLVYARSRFVSPSPSRLFGISMPMIVVCVSSLEIWPMPSR